MSKVKTLRLILASIFLIGSATACTTFVPSLRPTPWSTPTVGEMISDFSSPDANVRANAAAAAYHYHNHPDKALLVPYLVEALLDAEYGERSDFSVRLFAAQSIGMLGIYDERAIEILISWLDDESVHGEELIYGIKTLKVFASYASDATPGLIRVMMNPPPTHHPRVQQAAVRALGAIGDPVAVPYLLLIFLSADEQSWVHESVSFSLAYYDSEAICTVPYLVPLLDSPEPDVRTGAALVISRATGNTFPDSEQRNWDPEHGGPWNFEQGSDGEYLIVTAAKEWWQKVGQYREWPQCTPGLDGEPVLPAPGS